MQKKKLKERLIRAAEITAAIIAMAIVTGYLVAMVALFIGAIILIFYALCIS